MITDAKWICSPADLGEMCPIFSKNIQAKKPVKKAELRISATGVYEARINGRRIGEFILAPGCTSYRSRLQYQIYDITDILDTENRLRICLGKGWYRGRISANDKQMNKTNGAIIAELSITYDDGEKQQIMTDASWFVSTSRVIFSDIYDGETYDASAEIKTLGNAVEHNHISKSPLIPQEGEDITEHERIRPVKLFTTPKGERVLDFGQNIAGYVSFALTANKGDKLVLSHAEELDKEGNFYTENYRSANAKLVYICRDGRQEYKPFFTYFGFRYVRIDEYPNEIIPDDFTAIAVYSDLHRTGQMETGNAKINKLYQNTLWSQRDNFVDIPTDCPQRDERMGWLGDAQVFAKTACYNYNAKKFFRKWLKDLCTEQRKDGSVPNTAPNFWLADGSSTAWGDAIAIIPWQLYVFYGDKKILAECFESMKKWVDYITNDTLQKYLWTCTEEHKKQSDKHYGDWLALDAPYGSYVGASNIDLIASAFYAYSTELLIKAGNVLNHDMREYEELYQNIVRTFQKTFHVYNTQTECVLALHFHLTNDKQATAGQLIKMIRDNNGKMTTGFVGTPYLLHALSENGYANVAYDLLLQEAYPSWLYEVNHGATTIWEHWDGIRDDGTFWNPDMNSYNHYAYGSVVDWLYSVAAGIKPIEKNAGFKEAAIMPIPDKRLGSIRASLETAYGNIQSAWKYEGDTVRYEITTPVETLIVIDGNAYSVNKGSYVFYGHASGDAGGALCSE